MEDVSEYVVRIRGLPWSVSDDEVKSFFEACTVTNVHFTFNRDGRPSGEAFVEFANDFDVNTALSKDQQSMGKRYIEVFRSSKSDMLGMLEKSGSGGGWKGKRGEGLGGLGVRGVEADAVVRLRGLPFTCSDEDVIEFFSDNTGRPSGDAYVQFYSAEDVPRAMAKHKKTMGHRYVEVFRSSLDEAINAIAGGADVDSYRPKMGSARGGGAGSLARPSPYDRPGRGGMRGAGSMYGMGGGGASLGGSSLVMKRRLLELAEHTYDDGVDAELDEFEAAILEVRAARRGLSLGGGGMSGGRVGMGAPRRGMAASGVAPPRRGGGGKSFSSRKSETGHSVHMRGLPFSATVDDIYKFFSPLVPMNVEMSLSSDGRPSGEADADFSTHSEAQEAMKKNKANIGTRYVELFINSQPSAAAMRSADSYGGSYSSFAPGGGGGYRDSYPSY